MEKLKKVIEVGSQVSRKVDTAGILTDGVVTRVDIKNGTASVMWRIEDGLLAQSEKISELKIVEKIKKDNEQ